MTTENTNVSRSGLSSLANSLARVLPGSGPKKQSGSSSGASLAIFSAFAALSLLFIPHNASAQGDTPESLTISFGESSYTAIENGAKARIRISLDKPADRAVSVPINTSPATGDFSLSFSNADFAVGEQHRTLVVTASDDADINTESVSLSFGARPAGVSAGTPSSATVSLWDDDIKDLTISFAAATSQATEGGSARSVTIRLNAATDRDLRIPITASGEDKLYTVSASEVVFSTGQSSKSITVTPKDDDNLSNDTVILGFGESLPVGVTVGTQSTHTMTLVDDGMRILQFAKATDKVTEKAGETNSITVTVNLKPAPTSAVNVPISFSAPPSTNPHFEVTGLAQNRVSIASGATSGSFTVTAKEDPDKVSETITFRIGTPLPATARLGKNTSIVVTVEDDDGPTPVTPMPKVAFTSANSGIVNEGSSITVPVTLSPVSDKEVKVDVTAAVTGSNWAASDVKLTPATLTFAAGVGRQTVTVAAQADGDITNETVTLQLGTPTGDENASLGIQSDTGLTILDDRKQTVTLTSETKTLYEGGESASVSIQVEPPPSGNASVVIPVTVSPGSGDFTVTGLTNGRVTVNSSGTTSVTVAHKANDGNTADSEVTLSLGSLPSNVKAGKTKSAKIALQDATRPALSFEAAAYLATENGAAATVPITLSMAAEQTVTVPISTSGADNKTFGLSASEVVFAKGELRKTITVTALPDDNTDTESLILSFGAVTPSTSGTNPLIVNGAQTETTVSLVDDLQRVVTITAVPKSIAADVASTVTVTVKPGPTAATDVDITVNASSADSYEVTAPAKFANKVTIPAGGGESGSSATFTVTAKADANDVDDTVTFGLGGLPAGYRAGSASSATVKLPEPGVAPGKSVLSFARAAYTAIENGDPISVVVSLEPAASKKTTIPISLTENGNDSDYTTSLPSNNNLVFAKGDSRKTITITAIADEDVVAEIVTLSFGELPSNVVTTGSQITAVVTLVDDGIAKTKVSFADPTVPANEGDGSATVTVNLAPGSAPGAGKSLTIPIIATANFDDYILSPPRRVTFTGDSTSESIEITTTNDDDIEVTDLKVTLSLGQLPADRIPGDNPKSVVTFTDDDREMYTVDFNKNPYDVKEGKTVKVQVDLAYDGTEPAKWKGADRDLTIPIVINPSSTAQENDYSLSAMEVVIAKGKKSGEITFTANEDPDAGNNEFVALSIGKKLPNGVKSAGEVSTQVNIEDAHLPRSLAFEGGSFSAIEGGADATVVLNMDVKADRALMIPIATTPKNGPFMLEADGLTGEKGAYMLAFAKNDKTKMITVKATKDANSANDTVTLAVDHTKLVGGVTAPSEGRSVSVTLVDDMMLEHTVSFAAAAYTAKEGGADAMVMVTLDPPVPSGSGASVEIPYTVTPQNGTVAADYTVMPAGNKVTFTAGQTSQTIAVKAVNNTTPATNNGMVDLALGTLPTGVKAGDTTATTVTLEDDDRNKKIVAYFSAATATATEGGAAATVSVMLDLGEGVTELDRSLTLPITATGGDDGDVTVPKSVMFAAGASGDDLSTEITITANLDNDNVSEMVTLAFGKLSPGVAKGGAGKAATVVVTLTDDGLAALTASFAAATYTAMEGGTAATVTVSLNAASDRDLTIPIMSDPATGDFELSASEVMIASGQMSADITVTASYDDDTSDDEVTLSFGDLPSHVAAGDTATTTVALEDDGLVPLTVIFGSSTYMANEGGAAINVAVVLNRVADREITIPISVDPSDGPFTISATEVVFAQGQRRQNISITASLDDNTEDATVNLAFGTLPDRVGAGDQATTAVTLTDDGLVPLTVSFDADAYNAMEGGDAVSIMVNLNVASDRDLMIPINADPGQGDFEVSASSVMFAAGDMSKEITVTATLDDDTDDDMLSLTIGALPDRVSAGANTSAMVTLVDDGMIPLTVSFDADAYTAMEDGADATVTVNLDQASDRDVTIPITTDPAEGDFELSASSVTFAAGDTSMSITVSATTDSDVDDDTVMLGLGDLPARVYAGDPSSATVTLEDKGYTVSFAQALYSIRESERGSVMATISPAANGQVSVPISVAHVRGATAQDYSGVPSALTFSGGQSQTSFTVAVTADEVNDPNEAIDISLANLPDKVNAGDLDMTTVEFEQFRTPEQFSRTLQAALAVVAGAMGDSAVSAIENRFERYRESMGNGGMATILDDSDATYGHWSDMEAPGMAMTGHSGSSTGYNYGPSATTRSFSEGGTPLSTLDSPLSTGGAATPLENNIQLGGLVHSARPGEAVIASGYGMAPQAGGQDVNFSGVAFEMAADNGGNGKFSPVVWLHGDLQRFDGEIEDLGMDFDGGLDAIHLGVDLFSNGSTLAGVSLMQSWGDLSYTDDGVDGSLDSSMSTFHPYVYFQPNKNLGVWGILGFGSGSVDVSEPDRTHEFDADFSMFAGGVRSVIQRRDNNELGVSADAFTAELSTDAADDIPGVKGSAQRARVMVDWLSNNVMEGGQDLSWKAEVGARFDGGDGIEGAGIEAGFRVGLLDSAQGLEIALGARALLLHENDVSDYGLGVQATWDPGEKRKGFVASVASSYGQDAGGSTSLWDNGNAIHQNGIGAMWMETQLRVDGEVGYAGLLPPLGLPGTVMPYSRARWSGYGQEFGVGTRWTPSETAAVNTLIPATFELEGLSRETRAGLSDLALVLRMSIPFGGDKAIVPTNSRKRAMNEAAMGPSPATSPDTATSSAPAAD